MTVKTFLDRLAEEGGELRLDPAGLRLVLPTDATETKASQIRAYVTAHRQTLADILRVPSDPKASTQSAGGAAEGGVMKTKNEKPESGIYESTHAFAPSVTDSGEGGAVPPETPQTAQNQAETGKSGHSPVTGEERAALCGEIRGIWARLVADGLGIADGYALHGLDLDSAGSESARIAASLDLHPTAYLRGLVAVLRAADRQRGILY